MKGKHDVFKSVFSNVILSSSTLWFPWHPIPGLFIVLNKPMLHKKSFCLETSPDSTRLW